MPSLSLAPPNSLCAIHPAVEAPTLCERCGAFMCRECSVGGTEGFCPACRIKSGFDVARLARAYKSLVLWFGTQLLFTSLNAFVPQEMVPVKVMVSLAILTTLVAVPIHAYRTAKALGSNIAWLWAILIFIPCVNTITLLVLSSRATSECRKRGIEVGFFGPTVP